MKRAPACRKSLWRAVFGSVVGQQIPEPKNGSKSGVCILFEIRSIVFLLGVKLGGLGLPSSPPAGA